MDNKNLQVRIARNIKNLRKEQGLTQEMLAEKALLTSRQICRVENMENAPSLKTIIKLARAFNVDISELYRDAVLTK